VIGPVFKVLSEANTDVEFAKVDVDEADEVAASCGIQAMPTFQFYKNGAKVDEMCGANKQELKDLILKLK
jgi:thioredoxin-like negative regulator of GroEL